MTLYGEGRRVESRFLGTAELVSSLPEGFQELEYPDGVVTTVIFGRHDTENGPRVPERGSLRFRYYSPDSFPGTDRAHVVDPTQIGTFMLKHSDHSTEAAVGNQKHNLPNISVGDACRILEGSDIFDDLAQYEDGQEMAALIREYYGDSAIMPIMLVQARRRHLLVEEDGLGIGPARITLDRETTFWPVVRRNPGDVLAVCRAITLPQNILEVKREKPLEVGGAISEALLRRLFGGRSDYEPRSRIKRYLGTQILDTMGVPRLSNSELQIVADPSRPANEVLRRFQEREIKIDTNADPREAIKAMPARPSEGLWVDPGFPTVVRFRFHTFNGRDDPLVAVEKHKFRDGKLLGSGFQHKRVVSDGVDGEPLVRYEVLAPSLPELWNAVGQRPIGPGTVTQFADRIRHQRRVVCESTGNVFVILADYCRPESGDRAPLFQTEIEHLGPYEFDATSMTAGEREAQIAADFERVRQVTLKALGPMVTGGQTTKQEWLTALGSS